MALPRSADPHGGGALAGLRLLAGIKTAESKIDSALHFAFLPFPPAIFWGWRAVRSSTRVLTFEFYRPESLPEINHE
jgi:hypothetical protein